MSRRELSHNKALRISKASLNLREETLNFRGRRVVVLEGEPGEALKVGQPDAVVVRPAPHGDVEKPGLE